MRDMKTERRGLYFFLLRVFGMAVRPDHLSVVMPLERLSHDIARGTDSGRASMARAPSPPASKLVPKLREKQRYR